MVLRPGADALTGCAGRGGDSARANLLYHRPTACWALPRAGMDAQQVLASHPQATLMQQIAGGIFNGSLDWNMLAWAWP